MVTRVRKMVDDGKSHFIIGVLKFIMVLYSDYLICDI